MLDRDEKKKQNTKNKEGGRGEKEMREILSIQPLLHKSLTSKQAKKTTKANNNVNKLRPGKLREITKCLLTRFSQIQVDI